MIEEATQQGAEPSIHDKLMARLEPQPRESEEVIQQEPSAEESTDDVALDAEAHDEPNESPEMEGQDDEESRDASDDSEPQLQLSDLAEYLGIETEKLDVDDDGNILVKTKVDGEEGVAKFSDLIKSHQLEGHLNKQNMEVVEQKKALEQHKTELETAVQTKLQEIESLTEVAWNELTAEYNAIDWNELRSEDPAEYAAKIQDFEMRKQNISQSYQKVQHEKQAHLANQQVALREHLQAENQKLATAIEGWDSPEKAKTEFNEVMSYLKDAYQYGDEDLYGITDQQGNITQPGISDHRLVIMARKAMLYDKLKSTKPEVTKKVRKAPKIAKPGATKPVDLNAKKIAELKQNVIKTGGKQGSVAAYLMETGKV